MTDDNPNTSATTSAEQQRKTKKRRRWGQQQQQAAPATTTERTTAAATSSSAGTSTDPAKAKVLAMQESIRQRLAAAKAKQQQQPTTTTATSTTTVGVKRPLDTSTMAVSSSRNNQTKRAKQFDLDMTVTGPTFAKQVPFTSATTKDGIPQKTTTTTTITKTNKKTTKPKSSNPYLAHQDEDDDDDNDHDVERKKQDTTTTTTSLMDERLPRASKSDQGRRRPRPTFAFAEPGYYVKVAEKKREQAQKAQVSGYVSGRKTGHTIQSAAMGTVYGPSGGSSTVDDEDDEQDDCKVPRADAHPDTSMPQCCEWWDVPLLPSALKKQVANYEEKVLSKQSKAQLLQQLNNNDNDNKEDKEIKETKETTTKESNETTEQDSDPLVELRRQCLSQASLSYSKTSQLVQHIVPILPPHIAARKPKEAVLHLTKKELKRQRKLRRQQKQRELQDLQAAGLIPAPEPRLTLQNFIQVLGDQAYVDPSQMEQKVAEQMQKRQQKHLEMNAANKLTKEQRAEKRKRKLQEDTTQTGIVVAIFYVKDMSHPYHRTKVDLNAQQNNLTGGVLECDNPDGPPGGPLACVICEGGPKAIKRYRRLMEVRMKWKGPDGEEDEEEEEEEDEEELDEDGQPRKKHKFNPDNKCELIWQGMSTKRHFTGFIFQHCETAQQARKVLKAKGVAHYWDQVVNHVRSSHLVSSSGAGGGALKLRLASSDEEDGNPYADNDDDIVMKDA